MEQYEKDEFLAQKEELALILCAKYSVEECTLRELAKTTEDKDLYKWLAFSHMKWNFLSVFGYNINMAKAHNLQSSKKIEHVHPSQLGKLKMKPREEEKPKAKKKKEAPMKPWTSAQ